MFQVTLHSGEVFEVDPNEVLKYEPVKYHDVSATRIYFRSRWDIIIPLDYFLFDKLMIEEATTNGTKKLRSKAYTDGCLRPKT
jgi:hypothetical protein